MISAWMESVPDSCFRMADWARSSSGNNIRSTTSLKSLTKSITLAHHCSKRLVKVRHFGIEDVLQYPDGHVISNHKAAQPAGFRVNDHRFDLAALNEFFEFGANRFG
jgi:hypothetical protein